MKKFLLFLAGLVAVLLLLANLGPLILLGISIWLLYLVWKQFIKTDSTVAKLMWVIVGLIILSITFSNMYALIGVVAAVAIYVIYKKWNDEPVTPKNDDPFVNFEEQWGELNK